MPKCPDSEGASATVSARDRPAYAELAEAIRERIDRGELRIGQRIPSEQAIAERERVSRPTVREALRMLQEAGHLERVSPRILVVARTSEQQAERALRRAFRQQQVSLEQVCEALLALDPEIHRLATLRATDEELATLRGIVEAQDRAVSDPAEWNRLSRAMHLRVAELAHNPVLEIARGSMSELIYPFALAIYDRTERIDRVQRFNRLTVADMVARDADSAAFSSRRAILDFQREGALLDAPTPSIES